MFQSIFKKSFILVFLCVCFSAAFAQTAPQKIATVEEVYPGLATGILKTALPVSLKKGLILSAEGIEVEESFLEKSVAEADPGLREELKKNLFFLLEQKSAELLLLREAKRRTPDKKATDEEVIQSYLRDKFALLKASDEEIRVFYEENKDSMSGMPLETVKETIRDYLIQQKKQELVVNHIEELGRAKPIRLNTDWVKKQSVLALDNPVDKARSSGKIIMIEFGATGCRPCDMMQPILESLRKKHPQNLHVLFINVREQRILGARYGIRSIPAQVFYDKKGQEVFRHIGFYPEKEIDKKLSEMGL
ncbi:MAG: thioredoxin [Desulfobacteraceae bacterium]|nr:MAG: thioredoxin [Desulfobacteraceae bacterium]